MTIKGNYFTPGRSAPFEATLHVGNSDSQTVQIELEAHEALATGLAEHFFDLDRLVASGTHYLTTRRLASQSAS